MSSTDDFIHALQKKIQEYEENIPHLKNGLSGHGKCLLFQAFSKVSPVPFDAYGYIAPGTALHKYMQEEIFKPGSVFMDKYVIIGHEQMVFLWDNGKAINQSPIDTLVYNKETEQYEIWDYKSSGKDVKYISKLSLVYRSQANLYAYLFMINNNLPYLPSYKVIFFSKKNWLDIKVFEGVCSPALAQLSILRIKAVNDLAEAIKKDSEDLKYIPFFAEGLRRWDGIRYPYLSECKYCPYLHDCVKLLRRFGDITIEDIVNPNKERVWGYVRDTVFGNVLQQATKQ